MKFSQAILAFAAAASSANALGINCRGSAVCSFDKKGAIDTIMANLRTGDDNETYGDGQQIACQEDQICLFYQKTGRSWTRRQTRDFLQGLIGHGCQACGSIPVDPGNNVDTGMLTVNWVSELQKRSPAPDPTVLRRSANAVVAAAAKEPEVDTAKAAEPTAKAVRSVRFSPRDSPKVQLAKRLGINCRGSGVCPVALDWFPIGSLQDVRNQVNDGGDGIWRDGEHITCVSHQTGRLCAFYQNIGDRSFDKGQTLSYLDRLMGHGCNVCGSVPTDDGNNVANGQLTVNYVA